MSKSRKLNIIGWSEGQAPALFYDGTGVFHAQKMTQTSHGAFAESVCDYRITTSGQVEKENLSYGHPCAKCMSILRKKGQEDRIPTVRGAQAQPT